MEIIIYTTTNCSYCMAAKQYFKTKGWEFKEVDLSNNPSLREELSSKFNGWRTVPMILINGSFVGGYQDLVALDRQGRLPTQKT